MNIAAKSFAVAVNHLLSREAWARERLMRYAGQSARLILPLVELELIVREDGTIAAWHSSTLPESSGEEAVQAPAVDVVITVSGQAFSAFAAGTQAAAIKHVRIEGDAEFASVIAKLAERLRWEPEEDLARMIGDAPAHRMASIAQHGLRYARRTGRNFVESAAEYWLDEAPQLVRHAELLPFGDELALMRDALARLEKRIERAEQQAARRLPTFSADCSDAPPASGLH